VDFLTIDGYDYAGSWDKQTNESSSLYDTDADPVDADARYIDATVRAYLQAGVSPTKYTMGAVVWGRLEGRPQREPWRVPERDRTFSGALGRWIGTLPESRQGQCFARL